MAEQKELITFEMDAEKYKIMHRIIDSVTDKCGITFTKDGLSSITIDNASIAMGSLNMKKSSFVEYNLHGQKPLTIGFDVDKLKEIGLLEDYNKGNIRFTIFECKGIMCKVHHDIFNDTVELPPMDTVRMPTKMCTVEDTISFTMGKQELSRTINHRERHDSVIQIICNNNSVHFKDEQPSKWATDKIQIDETGEEKSKYGTQYLSDIVDAIPDTTPIEFRYKTDFPCELKIEFAEGCTATWMVAPLLESD